MSRALSGCRGCPGAFTNAHHGSASMVAFSLGFQHFSFLVFNAGVVARSLFSEWQIRDCAPIIILKIVVLSEHGPWAISAMFEILRSTNSSVLVAWLKRLTNSLSSNEREMWRRKIVFFAMKWQHKTWIKQIQCCHCTSRASNCISELHHRLPDFPAPVQSNEWIHLMITGTNKLR